LGESYPKALLPVLGRPLVAWQLDALKRHGVEEVVIVVGHLGHRIREVLGDGSEHGMRLVYREQAEPQGIAQALGCARDAVDRPFALLLGDIFFAPGDLRGVLDRMGRAGTDGVLVVRHEEDLDKIRRNFTVELEGEWVRRVVEKPKRPATNLKGTGLYGLGPGIFDAISRTERSPLRGEYELTDAIQGYIDKGARLATFETNAPDFNLSGVKDILELNLYALGMEGIERFVEETAEVEGAKVERSVVLAGARVQPGARLRDCLVFPGERVGPGDYRRTVFVGESVLACEGGAEPGSE